MCMGIALFEQIACKNPYLPLKVQGLSAICNEEDTIDDMKEICLKHMDLVHVEPEARLGFRVLSTAMMLHNINSARESAQLTPSKPLPTATISAEISSIINDISEKY